MIIVDSISSPYRTLNDPLNMYKIINDNMMTFTKIAHTLNIAVNYSVGWYSIMFKGGFY